MIYRAGSENLQKLDRMIDDMPFKISLAVLIILFLTGCSHLSHTERGVAFWGVSGAAIGGLTTGGAGALVGGAVGASSAGILGHQIDKDDASFRVLQPLPEK